MPRIRRPAQLTAFSEFLGQQFRAGKPSREVFGRRILEFVPIEPGALRKNRATGLKNLLKNVDRWVTGSNPGEKSLPAIKFALKEEISDISIERIRSLIRTPIQLGAATVDSSTGEPAETAKRTLYKFATIPRVIMSSWTLLYKSKSNTDIDIYSEHPADTEAYRLIASDIELTGLRLDFPVLCTHPTCPSDFSHDELILICGPHGNTVASQLNDVLAESTKEVFYFKKTGEDQWEISHTIFGDMSIIRAAPGEVITDYGIIYVGENPATPERHLIWVAGLSSDGTPGAANGFVQPEIQAEIARRLNIGCKYVSAVVKYERTCHTTGGIVHVLFA